MEEREEMQVLSVRMLGGFSMVWNGVELIDGRQAGSQFCALMQTVLFYHDKGAARAVLKEMLFEDREVDDVSHAIRNVIYNARKRLKLLGMPEANYLEVRRGIYYWTDEVALELDTDEMERLYQAAKQEEDPELRLALYLQACRLYRGAFLEQLSIAVWVIQEAHRFRGIYQECVNGAAELLRARRDYRGLKELGERAAKADPFAEWEVLIVEALAGMGRYKEAEAFCEETVDRYIWEHGQRTAAYVRAISARMSAQLMHQHDSIDDIQEKLIEAETAVPGGFYCSYPAFQEVYRILSRTMDRQEDRLFLMLCTLVDGKGNPMREGTRLDETSERFMDAVLRSVRHSDTVTRYGKGQYLVLLVNTSRENCSVVQRRIDANFKSGRQRTGIEYQVKSVILNPKKFFGK